MQRNIAWALLLPVAKWAVGAAVLGGSGYLGYREIQQLSAQHTQELTASQQAARAAQQEQEAQTRQTLQQLNPLFIVGTIATTGLGMFVMLRGMQRERMRSEYY